jgi:hypothetical protein
MGQTQRIEPSFFRSDPHQPTIMLDLAAGAYMGRALGTTPPPPVHAGRRPGTALLLTMLAMTAIAIAASLTYWFLVDTEDGRLMLDALFRVIASPL